MTPRTHASIIRAFGALSLLAALPSSQALVGYDGVTGDFITFTGAPGLCAYPGGPIHKSVGFTDSFACTLPPLPGDPATTTDGCVVVQEDGNYTVSGGSFAGRYDATGLSTEASDLSAWGYGSLTGNAVQRGAGSGGADAIWYTDGTRVGLFSAGIACGGLPGLLFAVSFTSYTGPGILTGLSFDYSDDTIWACTSVGRVVHFNQSGTELSSFTQVLSSLSSVAVDAASGTIYTTDGTVVAGYDATGTLTTDYWWPSGAEGAPGALVGLDWIPAALSYGTGSNPGGGTVPTLTTDDWSYVGNAGYTLDVSGAPSATYLLYFSLSGNLCPAVPVLGLDLLIAPPFISAGTQVADGAGNASFPVPLPADPSTQGVVVNMQAASLLSGGGFASTPGLVFTIANYN